MQIAQACSVAFAHIHQINAARSTPSARPINLALNPRGANEPTEPTHAGSQTLAMLAIIRPGNDLMGVDEPRGWNLTTSRDQGTSPVTRCRFGRSPVWARPNRSSASGAAAGGTGRTAAVGAGRDGC